MPKKVYLIGIGTFLIIFIGQVLWIFFFGVNVPMGDQWDGDFFWYKALISNNANWDALIAPHNEHRIAATRLFNGMIFLIMGGWHPIVIMYAQSVLISVAVAGLCCLLFFYAGEWRALAILFTLVAFLSPYSWQNTLNAFQNQFYFMLLFGFLAIGLLAWSDSWWAILLSLFFAAISPFATAGGMLTIVVFIFILMLVFFARRFSLAKLAVALMLFLPVAVWHITKLHHVAGHDRLKAQSVGEFCVSLIKVLSWPEAPIGLFLWGVIAYGIIRSCRQHGNPVAWLAKLQPIQIFVIGLLAWLFLQLAATAYSRTHADLMAGRYQQIYSLLIPLFFLSLSIFNVQLKWLRAWLVVILLIVGLVIRNGREWPYMTHGVAEMRFAKAEITKAVAANSLAYLKSKERGDFSLGYFTAEAIWQRVHDEKLWPYHLWLKRGPQQ